MKRPAKVFDADLEGLVPVSYILEEVDLTLVREQGRCNRVNRSIAPSLVVEASSIVEMLKVVDVSL